MKTGTIVYLADAQNVPEALDAEAEAARQGLPPEWTEVAASAPGYRRVPEALLELARRGATRIELVAGRVTAEAGLRLGTERLRLQG